MTLIEGFYVIIVGILTYLLAVYFAGKRRRLAIEALNISNAVLQMDELMLDSGIVSGGICHDLIFKGMSQVQRTQQYGLKSFLKPLSEQQKSFIKLYTAEIETSDARLRAALELFSDSYYRAAKVKSPLRFFAILTYLTMVLIFNRGFLAVLETLKHLSAAGAGWDKLKEQLQRDFVARSISTAIQ
jgi:hypothetical protein